MAKYKIDLSRMEFDKSLLRVSSKQGYISDSGVAVWLPLNSSVVSEIKPKPSDLPVGSVIYRGNLSWEGPAVRTKTGWSGTERSKDDHNTILDFNVGPKLFDGEEYRVLFNPEDSNG